MNTVVSDWNGYKKINFTVGGRESYIVCPKNPLEGKPWVWRAEFFGAFDYADRALLEKGWFLAYHCVSDMYGNPESVVMMREFYDVAVKEFGLSLHPAIFGFSRGGLYSVNFVLAYPDIPGVLYLDAPVTDIRSWPCGFGRGEGDAVCAAQCLECFGLTQETLDNFKDNPLDNAEKLALTSIPVMLVCGDSDKCVPYEENGKPFYERFKSAGGIIEQIVKPGCDHHPHSLADPSPIVEFIEKHIR